MSWSPAVRGAQHSHIKEAGSRRLDPLVAFSVDRDHFGTMKWIFPVNLDPGSRPQEALLGDAASAAVQGGPLCARLVTAPQIQMAWGQRDSPWPVLTVNVLPERKRGIRRALGQE